MIVTLKLATSLDGRIALASGESRWITGEQAREQVHRLRAAHSGILVGIDTVLADDPALNVRLTDYAGRQPARIILDSRLRTPPACKLVSTCRETRTIIFTLQTQNTQLTDAGVEVLVVPDLEGRVDPRAALETLETASDIQSVIVEGGGRVGASFVAQGLVDQIEWFRAPIILGGDGRPAIGDLGLVTLESAPRFRRVSVEHLGEDLWERYVRV